MGKAQLRHVQQIINGKRTSYTNVHSQEAQSSETWVFKSMIPQSRPRQASLHYLGRMFIIDVYVNVNRK